MTGYELIAKHVDALRRLGVTLNQADEEAAKLKVALHNLPPLDED